MSSFTQRINELASLVPAPNWRFNIYYPVSATIVAEHPEMRSEIDSLDTLLQQTAPGTLRIERSADRLHLDPKRLVRLLTLYVDGAHVTARRAQICQQCDVILEVSDDYKFC